MDDSILISTKEACGLDVAYEAFDADIIMNINSALSTLYQMGVVPGMSIDDSQVKWTDLGLPTALLSMVKTYIYLKVRLVFDPPQTSFLLDAMKEQIEEYGSRLMTYIETETV